MIALGNACSRRYYPQAAAKDEGGAPSSDASEHTGARQDKPRLALVQSATAQFATKRTTRLRCSGAARCAGQTVRSLQRHRTRGVILRLPDEGSRRTST